MRMVALLMALWGTVVLAFLLFGVTHPNSLGHRWLMPLETVLLIYSVSAIAFGIWWKREASRFRSTQGRPGLNPPDSN